MVFVPAGPTGKADTIINDHSSKTVILQNCTRQDMDDGWGAICTGSSQILCLIINKDYDIYILSVSTCITTGQKLTAYNMPSSCKLLSWPDVMALRGILSDSGYVAVGSSIAYNNNRHQTITTDRC